MASCGSHLRSRLRLILFDLVNPNVGSWGSTHCNGQRYSGPTESSADSVACTTETASPREVSMAARLVVLCVGLLALMISPASASDAIDAVSYPSGVGDATPARGRFGQRIPSFTSNPGSTPECQTTSGSGSSVRSRSLSIASEEVPECSEMFNQARRRRYRHDRQDLFHPDWHLRSKGQRLQRQRRLHRRRRWAHHLAVPRVLAADRKTGGDDHHPRGAPPRRSHGGPRKIPDGMTSDGYQPDGLEALRVVTANAE